MTASFQSSFLVFNFFGSLGQYSSDPPVACILRNTYSLSASLDVLSGRCTRCVASCSQNTHRKRHASARLRPDHAQTTPRPFPDHSQTLYSLSASLDVLSGRCTRCVASCSQNTHRKRHTLGWRHVHWYVFLWACLCRHHTKTVLMSHEWLSASPLFAQISFQSGQQHVLARSSLSTAWCKLEEARTLHRNVNRNVTLNLFTDTHDFMKRLVNKGQ